MYVRLDENNPRIIEFYVSKTFGKFIVYAKTKSGLCFSVSPLLTQNQANDYCLDIWRRKKAKRRETI